jgi:lysophospholipase L1-like esterase
VNHLYGVGGRTIAKTYYNDLKVVRRKRPDVVFLQVGGNDILKESFPTLILVRMKRLVSVLLEKYHVSTVIVGSVFCRRKPRGLSRRAYDRKKQKMGRLLQNVVTAYLQENHIRTFSPHHFQVIVVSLSNYSAAYPVKMDIMFSLESKGVRSQETEDQQMSL